MEQDSNCSLEIDKWVDVNVWTKNLVFVLLSVSFVFLKYSPYLHSSPVYYDIAVYVYIYIYIYTYNIYIYIFIYIFIYLYMYIYM